MLKYLSKCKKLVCLRIISTIVLCVLTAGYSVAFKFYIDYCFSLENGGDKKFVLLSLALLLYIFVSVFFDFLNRHYRTLIRDDVMKNVRMDYFKKLLALDVSRFSEKDTGHYISRITRDLHDISNEYIVQFLNLIHYGFKVLFCVLAAIYLNWQIALFFLLLSAVIIVYTTSYEKKFAKLQEIRSQKASEFTIALKSLLRGFRDVKLYGSSGRCEKRFEEQVDGLTDAYTNWWKLETLYSPTCALFVNLLTFVAISGSAFFYTKGMLTIGGLVAVVYLSSMIFNPISEFFEELTYMKSYKKLSEDIFAEITQKPIINSKKIEEIDTIDLSSVSVKYSNSYILSNANLHLEKGKKYLIVGESGAGKTTLIKTIAGFIPYEGELCINGLDMGKIDKASLYNLLSYASQEPFIFDDSVRGNVDLAGIYSDDYILDVMQKVGLSEFLHEHDLSSRISDEVVEISGGEKQRLCLARALLKRPQLLLLDEITASLDKANTCSIEKLVSSLETTVLYVCHKPSEDLVNSFDSIIEVQDGNIQIHNFHT